MRLPRKFSVIFCIATIAVLCTSTTGANDLLPPPFDVDRAPGSEPYDPEATLFDNLQVNFTTALASQDSTGEFNIRSADDFNIPTDACSGGQFEVTRIRAQVIQILFKTQPFAVEILGDNGAGTAPFPDDASLPLYTFPETTRTDLGSIGFDTHLYELSFDTAGVLLPGSIVHWISVFGISAEENAGDFYNFFGASDGAAGSSPNAVLFSPDFEVFEWTPA
jgi:hypothetical protein